MTTQEKIGFKNNLKNWGLDLLKERINTAREAMNQAQEAANSEEKSSAGDKYETGRAMGQLQKEMHARHLAESLKELAALQVIPVDAINVHGAAGAILRTEGITFFISAGLGKQEVGGTTILFLSPLAPLARQLQNKRVGDSIPFGGGSLTIVEIF